MEDARAGDASAFARLYRAFGPMVHAIVLSRVSDAEVADLVQDVFVAALGRLPSLRDPTAFGGWLAAIARHRTVDHRRRRREVVRLDEEAWPSRVSIPTDAMAALRVIRALPEAYRETLVMRLVEGMNRTGDRTTHRSDGGFRARPLAPRGSRPPRRPIGTPPCLSTTNGRRSRSATIVQRIAERLHRAADRGSRRRGQHRRSRTSRRRPRSRLASRRSCRRPRPAAPGTVCRPAPASR